MTGDAGEQSQGAKATLRVLAEIMTDALQWARQHLISGKPMTAFGTHRLRWYRSGGWGIPSINLTERGYSRIRMALTRGKMSCAF
ncbi:hypothetical protein MUBE_08245 [Mycobacterium uberis]|uniref:Uncharacterized protein n=1 Tax=Mycobacterium uberis TaxID=2162698 RepID=A0A3E1HGI8_9MYCO|nr:hypothetical protein MUBE_08245 [Mycobacterium uberis]